MNNIEKLERLLTLTSISRPSQKEANEEKDLLNDLKHTLAKTHYPKNMKQLRNLESES